MPRYPYNESNARTLRSQTVFFSRPIECGRVLKHNFAAIVGRFGGRRVVDEGFGLRRNLRRTGLPLHGMKELFR